jgi:hypothetical protein
VLPCDDKDLVDFGAFRLFKNNPLPMKEQLLIVLKVSTWVGYHFNARFFSFFERGLRPKGRTLFPAR